MHATLRVRGAPRGVRGGVRGGEHCALPSFAPFASVSLPLASLATLPATSVHCAVS